MRLASRNATLVTGLVVILVFVGALYLSLTAASGLPWQTFRTASADFDHVGGLREGDDVRSASVRIGQVSRISYQDGKARVVLQLDQGEVLYQDARAAVVSRSALGQNFVMVDPGKKEAGELDEGGRLKDSGIVSPVNLDQVLSALDAPTRKATASTLRELGSGAAGHSQDLHDLLAVSPDLVADLEQVATALAEEDTDLDGMLAQTRGLAGRFDGRSEEVGRLISNLSTTVEAVSVDKGVPIDQILREAPSALLTTSAAMRDLRGPLADLDAGMKAMLPGARSLGQATPALRGALREGVRPLSKVPGVAHPADSAVRGLSRLMVDARPLAPKLEKTFDTADEPTAVLAPYMPELIRFFERWNSANQYGDKSGHYLRITLVIRPESGSGTVPIEDPLVHRRPYPAPGTADHDRAATILGGQR
jgi:phospholipid/cholesterol/gamma-HCH transport system substrate-binding protein